LSTAPLERAAAKAVILTDIAAHVGLLNCVQLHESSA
jgi:hypothetical protein